MLELKDREWKEFIVGDLFTIITGKAYNKNKMNLSENGLRHISRATVNHGIDCYASMDDYDDYIKYEGNCITVSSIPYQKDGTCAFYQNEEFCCGVGVNILNSDWLNSHNALFICNCINNAVIGKYGMARSLGASMLKEETLLLPVNSIGQPDYDFMEQYIREREPDYSWATGCIEPNAEISLQDREWAEFRVGDLFSLKVARGNDKGKLNAGDIPFIGRSNDNNGLQGFFDAPNVTNGQCITLGMVGTFRAFWQEEDFAASQNILTLRAPWLNRHTALFVCNMIETAIKGRYSYGNSIKAGTFGDTIINLPVDCNGQPDYEFMEQYIKSLPFSKVLA